MTLIYFWGNEERYTKQFFKPESPTTEEMAKGLPELNWNPGPGSVSMMSESTSQHHSLSSFHWHWITPAGQKFMICTNDIYKPYSWGRECEIK